MLQEKNVKKKAFRRKGQPRNRSWNFDLQSSKQKTKGKKKERREEKQSCEGCARFIYAKSYFLLLFPHKEAVMRQTPKCPNPVAKAFSVLNNNSFEKYSSLPLAF